MRRRVLEVSGGSVLQTRRSERKGEGTQKKLPRTSLSIDERKTAVEDISSLTGDREEQLIGKHTRRGGTVQNASG